MDVIVQQGHPGHQSQQIGAPRQTDKRDCPVSDNQVFQNQIISRTDAIKLSQNWCLSRQAYASDRTWVTTVAIALYLPPHRIHLTDPLPACPFVWCTYLSSVDQTQSSRPAAHTNQESISQQHINQLVKISGKNNTTLTNPYSEQSQHRRSTLVILVLHKFCYNIPATSTEFLYFQRMTLTLISRMQISCQTYLSKLLHGELIPM